MGPRSSNDQRKVVAFGAGVVGGIMAFTSLAFACTPIVGLMTISNIHPDSPNRTTVSSGGTTKQSVTVGAGRSAVGGGMQFCADNWLTSAPNDDGVVGGATGDQGELITIEVAPAVCNPNVMIQQVTGLAAAIHDEVQQGNLDPREWPFVFDNESANFLFPDPAAQVNYHPASFSITNGKYTYNAGEDCMNIGDPSVNSGIPFGTMPIGPGTGASTFPIPTAPVAGPGDGWSESTTDAGGVCVKSTLGGQGGGPAIAMAPLTII